MRKLLFLLGFAYTFSIVAETQTSSNLLNENQTVQAIFRENFLNAEDNLDTLYLLASRILKETDSSLSLSELVKQFKQLALRPEIEDKFVSIYESQFSKEEIKEVYDLIQNDLYMKYRRSVDLANFLCFQESMEILKELAQTLDTPVPLSAAQNLTQITQDNINQILNSNRCVIIDVYTDWCGPCQYLAPIFKELNDEFGQEYQFAKLDAEKEESLAKRFQITGFPTILFIKDGEEVGRQVGFMSKEKLLNKIKYYFEE